MGLQNTVNYWAHLLPKVGNIFETFFIMEQYIADLTTSNDCSVQEVCN